MSHISFFLLPVMLIIVAACGFQPMYGKNGFNNAGGDAAITGAPTALSQVAIDLIPDRSGQFLRNALIDRLHLQGTPANPAYTLRMSEVAESIIDLDITVTSEATRRQIRLITVMALINNQTGAAVLTRDLQAQTSYNVLDSEYSTLVTERSAREAALNDLARQIEQQLVLYFRRQ
jgi:LPS-assembly lipoprotein